MRSIFGELAIGALAQLVRNLLLSMYILPVSTAASELSDRQMELLRIRLLVPSE